MILDGISFIVNKSMADTISAVLFKKANPLINKNYNYESLFRRSYGPIYS